MYLKIYMKYILRTSTGCSILQTLNSHFKENLKTGKMFMINIEEKQYIYNHNIWFNFGKKISYMQNRK